MHILKCSCYNKVFKVVYFDPTKLTCWDVVDKEEYLYMKDNVFEPIIGEDDALLDDLATTLQETERQLEQEDYDELPTLMPNYTSRGRGRNHWENHR